MFDNTRKYRLNVDEIISCGIGACCNTYQCNILESFTINGSTYSQITQDDLIDLNRPEYLNRVNDYLTHINIEDGDDRKKLIEDASIYTPECDVKCGLNSDFLVYRFLSGVRVIEIGDVNGEAEYRAYPMGDDPNNYTWQNSGTFLNVDLDKIYIFEIRDYVEGEELCKVQKTVSLPTLVQSTTFTPEDKLVYINQKVYDSSGDAYYNNGTLDINPQLSGDEIVSIDYTLFADASGDADSYAEIFCKPDGSSSYSSYCCQDAGNTTNDTLLMYAGDSICYNINIIVPTAGSCGCGCFDINSVSGGGTTSPSIDVSRCCETRSAKIERKNINVTLDGTTTYPSSGREKRTGSFIFTPDIPIGENVTLELNALAEITPFLAGANSSVKVRCRPNRATIFDTIFTHTYNDSQPLIRQITAQYGDELTYELDITAVDGVTSSASLDIIDIFNSNGITSTIGTPSSTSISKTISTTSVVAAMCIQNETTTIYGESAEGDGFITLSPALTSDQCVRIDFDGDLSITSTSTQIENKAYAIIYCKPDGSSSYSIKCCMSAIGETNNYKDNILVACCGDSLCYCVCACVGSPATAQANLTLTNMNGYNGVSASICSTKDNHSVEGSM